MKRIRIERNEWRDTYLRTTVWKFPSVVLVPFVLFIFHIEWWTFGLLVAVSIFLWVIDSMGYSIVPAMLALRAWIAGKVIKRRPSMFNKTLD